MEFSEIDQKIKEGIKKMEFPSLEEALKQMKEDQIVKTQIALKKKINVINIMPHIPS